MSDRSLNCEENALSMFSTGVDRARLIRSKILKAFDSEPEWTSCTDDDEIVDWCSGLLTTRFIAEAVHPSVTALGVLHVETIVARTQAPDIAESFVASENRVASLSRWVTNPDDVVTLRSSFVVGDPAAELPFRAMVLAVGQQIATATSVAQSLVEDEEPGVLVASPFGALGVRPRGSWNPVVDSLRSWVWPASGEAPAALLEAAVKAFELEREHQFETAPAAWYGSGDEGALTFEVPYGPGPFPEGVIGMRNAMPHLDSPANETSLVQGFEVENPALGRGLMLTLRLPLTLMEEELPKMVAALNNRSRICGEQDSTGSAHGLGAWILHGDDVTLTSFVPSGWAQILDEDELAGLYRQLLSNCARLSWDARRVIGSAEEIVGRLETAIANPDEVDPDSAIAPSLGGFAAGANARGPHFGETGVGVDPGAEIMAFVWQNLVGSDYEWAYIHEDRRGLIYWMGPSAVQFRSFRCGCDEHGSVVQIMTELGADAQPLRVALETILLEGEPIVVTRHDEKLWATSQLHVHSENITWTRFWAVTLAVCHGLLTERLGETRGDLDTVATPDGDHRIDRGGLLNMFVDLPQVEGFRAPSTSAAALLQGIALTSHTPHMLRSIDASQLEMAWLFHVPDCDSTVSVITAFGYIDHPSYGHSLRIMTELRWEGDPGDVFVLNALERQSDRSFTMGGFCDGVDGPTLVSLYPLLLDRSGSHTGQSTFVGTALVQHCSAVSGILASGSGVTSDGASVTDVVHGVQGLPAVYRDTMGASSHLEAATTSDGAQVEAIWSRSWPYPHDGWPRLGAIQHDVLRGSATISIHTDSAFARLKVIHAALAMSARPNYDLYSSGVPLAAEALGPTSEDLELLTGHLIEQGFLEVVAEGEAVRVVNAEATFRLQRASHPVWQEVTLIELVTSEPETVERLASALQYRIGQWSGNTYRVCLPAYVFGTQHWGRRMAILEDIVTDLLSAATRRRM